MMGVNPVSHFKYMTSEGGAGNFLKYEDEVVQ